MNETKQEWLQRVADMHGLDPEDIEEIAEMCLEDTEENLNVLINFTPDNLQEAIRAAHSIKGSSANIGCMDISDAAKNIEVNLKSSSYEMSDKICALQKALDDFKALMSS
jgi:HPt (histidine-containing phosphotransfer) domain-containing protein